MLVPEDTAQGTKGLGNLADPGQPQWPRLLHNTAEVLYTVHRDTSTGDIIREQMNRLWSWSEVGW